MAQTYIPGSKLAEHGQHIFIYGHVRTRQIIYSLSRTLDNNSGLKQLPFLGKKTKPPVIRKDFWAPLATVTFPSGPQGLSAYQQLREFRKRHELEWDLEPVRAMPKKERGRWLQDQKANSIADLALVLGEQAKVAEVHGKLNVEEEERRTKVMSRARQRMEELKRLKAETRRAYMASRGTEGQNEYAEHKKALMKLKRAMRDPPPARATESLEALEELCKPTKPDPLFLTRAGRARTAMKDVPRLTMDGVRIEWANILDAEFAKTWPEAVVHDTLGRGGNRTRHTPASSSQSQPAPVEEEELVEEEVPTETVAEEEVVQTPMKRLLRRLQFGRGG